MHTGENVSKKGVYKCTNCGNEVTCEQGERCPPCGRCSNTSFKPKDQQQSK